MFRHQQPTIDYFVQLCDTCSSIDSTIDRRLVLLIGIPTPFSIIIIIVVVAATNATNKNPQLVLPVASARRSVSNRIPPISTVS